MSVRAAASEPHPPALEGLPLLGATPEGWTAVALDDLDRVLADHAHCEQKAACTALALVARFPQHPRLAPPLLALAQEEIRHFRDVLEILARRGAAFTRPEPDRYVRALRSICCEGPGGLGAPADLLIVDAFVEARSCERFRLLAAALDGAPGADGDLGRFYRRLAVAERRHWEMFRDLACTLCPEAAVDARLAEVGRAEADLVRRLPLAPRMH